MKSIPQLVVIIIELSISKTELGDDVFTHSFHLVIRKDLQVTNIRQHRVETWLETPFLSRYLCH